jgi:hypothetical protein
MGTRMLHEALAAIQVNRTNAVESAKRLAVFN